MRIHLKRKDRLAQLTYLLKTKGPQSLQDLARLMGYRHPQGLSELLKRADLPPTICITKERACGRHGGGGNWVRHVFSYQRATND